MKDLGYNIRLMLEHKDFIRTKFFMQQTIREYERCGKKAAARLKDKEVIEVAFLLPIPGMWKADYLFRAMQKHPRFHPVIVIIPYSMFKGFSNEEIFATVAKTEAFIQERGFEYVIPYNKEQKRWEDIRKTLNPDIVFFSSPYRDAPKQYYLHHFKDRLTCYIPYGFSSMNLYALNYDLTTSNLFNLHLIETPMHLTFAEKYARSKGINYFVSGFPGTEVYLHSEYKARDVWKPQPTAKKRVIWAPHHTIGSVEDANWSSFLSLYNVMLEVADKYKDTIQFAFKPHQLLKFKLLQLWGEERTNAYYKQWADGENTQLEEAGYVDLFIGSDAMIHDCGSFTTEYLFLKKPVMYYVGNNDPQQIFNEFGKWSFELHYHGKQQEDIDSFLQRVVLGGEDTKAVPRKEFFNTYLAPQDGLLPSQKIIQIIENAINHSAE